MYQVIGNHRSRTLRVLWMLEELGEPYEHVDAMPQSAAVRGVNPAGKVPVLVVNGAPITDSTAILTYLADRHQRFTHAAGTLDRARQDSLTHFLLDELDGALWTAARHSFILPEELRLPAIKDSLKWEFERAQKTLVARMGSGPFLMGDLMTVPDIILAHCLSWARAARFPVSEPRLVAYADTLLSREALGRAMRMR
ncbi:MAG: glutathione S-transferase family protein [Paracoccaceae bacterium]|nr:MAG: glutathione S-transferase family protein [Paracoccaceae bacterium]